MAHLSAEVLREMGYGRSVNGGSLMESVVSRSMGGCGGCRAAGMCGACPLRSAAVISEVSVFKPDELTSLKNVATIVRVMGSLSFRPIVETVRPVPSEKTCSQCGGNSSTCPHADKSLKAA